MMRDKSIKARLGRVGSGRRQRACYGSEWRQHNLKSCGSSRCAASKSSSLQMPECHAISLYDCGPSARRLLLGQKGALLQATVLQRHPVPPNSRCER